MVNRIKFSRVFFGWWTVLAGGFVSMWVQGYVFPGYSALFKPIASELGISRTVASLPASIQRIEGGLEGPVVGWASDKFGPRWFVFFGVLIFGLGLILMYFISSVWAFLLVWTFVAMGNNIATGTPIHKAIADWFVKKRGLALSVKLSLQGLQGVVMLPLIAWLIIVVGWRTASLIGGLAMLAIGLPLIWFSVKQHRPEHYGLLPDGASVKEKRTESGQMVERGVKYAAEVEEVEFTFRQGIRTLPFWLLLIADIFRSSTGSISIHIIPLLTDRGIDPFKAAAMMTVIYATSIPARLVAGFLADHVTKGRLCFLLAAIYLLQATGYFIFVTSQTVSSIYIWFVLHGFGMGASLALVSPLRARYFGRKAFGSLSGFTLFLNMPVGMAAPIVLGWVYDTTGSYIAAFRVIAVLIVFAAVTVFFARPPKPPLQTADVRKIL